MQSVSIGDNLHDMSNLFSGKKKYFNMLFAENFTQSAVLSIMVNMVIIFNKNKRSHKNKFLVHKVKDYRVRQLNLFTFKV